MRPDFNRRHFLSTSALLACHGLGVAKVLEMDDAAPDSLGIGGNGQALALSDSPNCIHVVCFWATWCPPCKQALPIFESLQRKLGPEVLRTVLITREDRDVFRQIVRKSKELQVVFARDATGAVQQSWGSPKGTPFTAVIGHDGKVMDVLSGWGEQSTDWLLREVNGAIRARNATLKSGPG